MKEFFINLTKREILFIVVIMILLSATGYYAWKIKTDNDIKTDSINSFAECAAANNPIMESYPEQCAAGGKTFTNPNQVVPNSADETEETSSWLIYESFNNAYSIRIPDGWDIMTIKDTINLYGGRSQEGLVYKPGTQAKVEIVEGGWDGSSPFSLYVPGANYDQIVREGEKTGTLTTNTGQDAEIYYYVQTTEPEAIGYQLNSKVYNYYFGINAKYIQIQHVVNPGSDDQHERVEQMLKTLKVN